MLAVAKTQPTRLNATARGRCLPAGPVANRMPLCAARRAASGSSAGPCTRVWTFGATRKPAGTWAAACPWRRPWAHGGLRSVPSNGANKGRWATAGLHTWLRAACSGASLTGAPRRPVSGALHSALVGVQPTTVSGPRPSGPGKAAASSRFALHLRRDRVVSTASASERVETTPRNDARRNRKRFNKGGLWTLDWPQTAFRGSNTRKSRPDIANRQLFSPESQGHQVVGSGRVIPHEPLAG